MIVIRPSIKITTFATNSKDELSRQLSQLEDSVYETIGRLGMQAEQAWVFSGIYDRDCTAHFGEIVSTDSRARDISVTLPTPNAQARGQMVGIIRRSSAHAMAVSSIGAVVNMNAYVTLGTTTKLYLFLCDGAGWWSDA